MRTITALSLLLAGCPPGDEDKETGSDPSESGWVIDGTEATEAPCVDTGIAALYIVGEIGTRAGEFVGGEVGMGAYGMAADDWVCRVVGAVAYEGEAPPGCPDCEWAFDLSPIAGSIAVGDACADFGWSDGTLDGYFDYSWGFSSTYYYDYAGTPLRLENTVFLWLYDYWYPFAFNYGGRDWVYGDPERVEFERPLFSSYSYSYYYYYTGC